MREKTHFAVRSAFRVIPGLKPLYSRAKNFVDIYRLGWAAKGLFEGNSNSNIVVSLTSFPARIEHAWIPIESMFQQDELPKKVVLVLAEEDFPDNMLPNSLRAQEKRGLEILWTSRNSRSFKKLLPTREAYPDATIVTIDDDILYDPWMLSRLRVAAEKNPGAVVGHRGWAITATESGLAPYVQWPKAGPSINPNNVLLTGGAGALYPPYVLPNELLLNIDLAERLCPTADDIWFWAVARAAEVPVVCLGNHSLRELQQQRGSPALTSTNWQGGGNDVQFERVLDYFDLWQAVLSDAP